MRNVRDINQVAALSHDRSNLQEIPREYLCPINATIMTDPVIAEDGYTYEKDAIIRYLDASRGMSPFTRQKLDKNRLIPNRVLKDLIEAYKRSLVIPAPIPVPTPAPDVNIIYKELLKDIASSLEIDADDVNFQNVLGQVMVALVGIYTKQTDTVVSCDNITGNIAVQLAFSNVGEYQRFMMHYRSGYPNCIVNAGNFLQNKASIVFDNKIFKESILLQLADYKKNSHEATMRELAAKLNVSYHDVYIGSAVEQSLVNKAGIGSLQNSAYYRRQQDYTTGFKLSFASELEYGKFLNYYKTNYPNLIISSGEFNASGLSSVDVNTKKLLAVATQFAGNTTPMVTSDTAREPRPTSRNREILLLSSALASTTLSQNNRQQVAEIHSHNELMKKFEQELAVAWNDVYLGIAVEQALVGLAGINTLQQGATFRDNRNATTVFRLKFSSLNEFERFVSYFNEHFPTSIRSTDDYISNTHTAVVMDTNVLYNQISSAMRVRRLQVSINI